MLEVENLTVKYGGATAVHGVSFSLDGGELATIVGANGAGKSSTLRAIAGLERAATGRITLRGRDITRSRSDQRFADGLVLVPEGRAIIGPMTVKENLLLAGRDLGYVKGEFSALEALWDTPAGALSGGEQQMVAIARGLVSRPKVMLLDEPSMGLAPKLVKQIFSIIESIRANGTSILLVEQNANQALAVADHAYVFETGTIALQGAGSELLGDPKVMRAYLGVAADIPEGRVSATGKD